MNKCKECGREKKKEEVGDYVVIGTSVYRGKHVVGLNEEHNGISVADCIEQFFLRWDLDDAISVNFTVLKRP